MSIVEIAQMAGKEWRCMSQAAKDKFKAEYCRQKKNFDKGKDDSKWRSTHFLGLTFQDYLRFLSHQETQVEKRISENDKIL